MKKIIITILAAAAMAASCQKYKVDAPITPVSGPEVAVTVSEVGDSTFTVTLVPNVKDGNIQFFSCYIYESEEAEELDSCKVYDCSYSSEINAVYVGTVKYADSKSDTVVLKGLEPNTTYQIAAVAGSAMGIPGKITSAEVLTSDSKRPSPKSVKTDSMSVTVTFNKEIHLATENAAAKAYATYKRVWDPHETASDSLWFEVDSIVVEGNTMTLFAPEKIDGAYVFFTWDAGLVKSDVDSACAAYTKVIFEAEEGEIDEYNTRGIYTRIAPVSFGWTRMCYDTVAKKYVEADEDSLISYKNSSEYYLMPDSVIFNDDEPFYDISVTYQSSKKTTTFPKCSTDVHEGIICMGAAEEEGPEIGDYLTFLVKKDSFEDIWGNYCEEYSNSKNYMNGYGYKPADFLGTYVFSYLTDTSSSETPAPCTVVDTVIISKYKNYEDSVLVSGFFTGLADTLEYSASYTPANLPVYFDKNSGEISLDIIGVLFNQYIVSMAYVEGGYIYITPTFTMTSPGIFESNQNIYYAIFNTSYQLTSYYQCYGFDFRRTSFQFSPYFARTSLVERETLELDKNVLPKKIKL